MIPLKWIGMYRDVDEKEDEAFDENRIGLLTWRQQQNWTIKRRNKWFKYSNSNA